MLCPMFASSRRRIVVRCFEDEEAGAERRAVRVAFRWRKASVPNHLLPMLIYKNTFALIGTWSDHPGQPYYHKTYGSVLAN
jgi:hypothetical protein